MSLNIHESAVKRIEELRIKLGKPNLMLSVIVDSGGCAGFEYIMELTEDPLENANIFAGVIMTDDISVPYMAGSTISFVQELAGSEFVITNPNAKSGCGCGTSFSV
jgi:iron-sulfur cluster insertion protein